MHPSRLIFAGFVLFSLLLVACSSSSEPVATVEAFYQAAAKRDVDKAMEQVTFGEFSDDNEVLVAKGKMQMVVGQIAFQIEKNDGLNRIEVLESTIEDGGQNASVKVKVIFNNGEEENDSNRLLLENGKWKIVLG